MATKTKTILCWIQSSRGTDSRMVFEVPASYTKDDIQDLVERWCSNFGAWHVSGSRVTYGYRAIKLQPRAVLLKKYGQATRAYQRAREKKDNLVAMLAVKKLT